MTKIVKIRADELDDENPFLEVIFIVDLEPIASSEAKS